MVIENMLHHWTPLIKEKYDSQLPVNGSQRVSLLYVIVKTIEKVYVFLKIEERTDLSFFF